MTNNPPQHTNHKFIKYILVGIISLFVDYGIFIGLYYGLHSGTAVAAPVGLIAGLLVNFFLNKSWSFRGAQYIHNVIGQAFMYIVLVIINSAFTYYFIEHLKNNSLIEPNIGKLLSTGCVAIWNYVIYKKIIFRLS